MCYVILFIWFLLLMKRDEVRFAPLQCHVTGFFGIMIFLLLSSFVLDIIFYVKYDQSSEKQA